MHLLFKYKNYLVETNAGYLPPDLNADSDVDYYGGYFFEDTYVTDENGVEVDCSIVPEEVLIDEFEIKRTTTISDAQLEFLDSIVDGFHII